METTARIFSPRWGHDDTYTLVFEPQRMVIGHAPRFAECVLEDPNSDPVWGGNEGARSLDSMFRNDSIHMPGAFPDCLEYLWRRWRHGEIDNVRLEDELQLLVGWLNETTHAKPSSDFWRGYF